MKINKLELIDDIIKETESLEYGDNKTLDLLKKRGEMITRNVFGETSKYLSDINNLRFHPMMYPTTNTFERSAWDSGKSSMINLFNTMREELMLFGVQNQEKHQESSNQEKFSKKVFIVHGHDNAMKESVARVLTQLNLKPIILHEQPDKGRGIMEKFEDEVSDIKFAVVLLSGDDECYNENVPERIMKRARQNVILELGYFIGKIGKDKVLALHSDDKNFEMPSDYSGILYTKYDLEGAWKFKLAKELKSSGFDIDMNDL